MFSIKEIERSVENELIYLPSYTAIRPHGHSRQMRCRTEKDCTLVKRQVKSI